MYIGTGTRLRYIIIIVLGKKDLAMCNCGAATLKLLLVRSSQISEYLSFVVSRGIRIFVNTY